MTSGPPVFQFARVERPADLPSAERRLVDVAVLDMNHGWPNLGHDAVVQAVADVAGAIREALVQAGLGIRAVSFDVRRGCVLPDPAADRFRLYLGTGGPGHLDPRLNDGRSEGSQGLREDASWEAPLFRLFDAVLSRPEAGLLAVCHTFGVMCRWAGVARPVLRGPDKGGKSAGVVDNVLTPEALRHPWFSRLAAALPNGRTLPVVDHRLFDLVPQGPTPAGMTAIGYESGTPHGPAAVTMVEFAPAENGVPRIFGVNHHPEVADRVRQWEILRGKRERGEVDEAWYADRARILAEMEPDAERARGLALTSEYTLFGPLRHHLLRQVRRRAEDMGLVLDVDTEHAPSH